MKVNILGVRIDNLTFAQVLGRVEELLADGRPHCIVTPYAESVVTAQKDEEFRRIINQADLAVPDGVSLRMAAKYLRETAKPHSEVASDRKSGPRWRHDALPRGRLGRLYSLGRTGRLLWEGVRVGLSVFLNRGYLDVVKEEVKGTDLMLSLCEKAQAKGWRVFLLGGWDGVVGEAARKLKQQWNNVTIGSMAGSKNVKRETPAEWEEVREELSQFKPDLLFVSYGPVTQEKWIAKNLPALSAKVVIGVAGAFDMLAGRKPRAPEFLRRCGLEWLWRLIIEPSRLGRVYKAVVVFPWLVFRAGSRGSSSGDS